MPSDLVVLLVHLLSRLPAKLNSKKLVASSSTRRLSRYPIK